MKTLTIGRSPECDIHIPDESGDVSRRHALLKSNNLGKYEIIDVSKNGTYVNGVKIKPHRSVPVNRGDVVSFANKCKLDWNDVPSKRAGASVWLMILAALVAIGGIIWGVWYVLSTDDDLPAESPAAVEVATDRGASE